MSDIDWASLTGALLLINATQRIEDTTGDDQGLIEADIHVLDGPQAGAYENTPILQPALRDQLAGNVGTPRFNLGRLNTNGALDEATVDDRALARNYLAKAH